jgi:hypothetical protein
MLRMRRRMLCIFIMMCVQFAYDVYYIFRYTHHTQIQSNRLLSQYFDTLSVVGANSLILEHDPATVANLQQQVGKSFLEGKRR